MARLMAAYDSDDSRIKQAECSAMLSEVTRGESGLLAAKLIVRLPSAAPVIESDSVTGASVQAAVDNLGFIELSLGRWRGETIESEVAVDPPVGLTAVALQTLKIKIELQFQLTALNVSNMPTDISGGTTSNTKFLHGEELLHLEYKTCQDEDKQSKNAVQIVQTKSGYTELPLWGRLVEQAVGELLPKRNCLPVPAWVVRDNKPLSALTADDDISSADYKLYIVNNGGSKDSQAGVRFGARTFCIEISDRASH